jgi:regulator of sigma E protease
VIVAATIVPPEEQTPEQRKLEYTEAELEFGKGNRNWASLTYLLQRSLPGTQVKLEWTRQKEEMSATLQPQECSEWFNPDRGFRLDRLTFPEKAETLGEAVSLGARETLHATLVVYRVLQKLGTQQVSFKALGGPISIFVLLKQAAQQSTPELLITLTILSANLAVLNFLPIPVLDGGHMVFLAWEGIRGKPADERVQFVLTCIGLALILSLMIWVIALDIGRWFSGFF